MASLFILFTLKVLLFFVLLYLLSHSVSRLLFMQMGIFEFFLLPLLLLVLPLSLDLYFIIYYIGKIVLEFSLK